MVTPMPGDVKELRPLPRGFLHNISLLAYALFKSKDKFITKPWQKVYGLEILFLIDQIDTMGSKSVQLKVFVDKKKKKVMFAEAEDDFVEILFSFLTLPLGTIARISSKHEATKDTKVGSLDSLYESIENLDVKHFTNEHCKVALVSPNSSSLCLCQKLKIDLNNTKPVDASVGDVVFLKKRTSFIVTDDLNVIPVMLDTSITLLKSLGVEYIDLLEERTMDFGLQEFSSLLKWSLVTNTPLTNLVLGETRPNVCTCSPCIKNSLTSKYLPILSSSSTQRQTVKLLIQKSKKKVLCAQVENFFVEMLFSFLTIPLGNAKRLTKDNSPLTGIDNVYNSISSLGDRDYLKSEEIKSTLLCPKLASNYLRVTDLLPIYEKDKNPGSFLKEQATYIVSDNLEIAASPASMSTISKFNALGIPNGDIEVMEVIIGEQEALLILKASLNSTSALTDCLSSFKNAKSLF
ncbi:hypothetical protein QVD17_33668 [Tagetes erecta]|uniref:Uncharacterized protein n=1 Tax=Tagetes erecta TaxID=13708 RepID=A0AAD8JYL9_TARER|nr:hypothetical protein QVD17_33668 [Tagetes erecta]